MPFHVQVAFDTARYGGLYELSPPNNTSTLFVESYANDSFSNAVGETNGYWAFQSGPGSSDNGVPDTNVCTPSGDAEEDEDDDDDDEEAPGVNFAAAVVGVGRDATGNVTVEPSDRTI